jgi:hypothetical protein
VSSHAVSEIVLTPSVSHDLLEATWRTTGLLPWALQPFTGSAALSLTTSANLPLPEPPGATVTLVSMFVVIPFASPLIVSAIATPAIVRAENTSRANASVDLPKPRRELLPVTPPAVLMAPPIH